MKCSNCGMEIEPSARKCSHCGQAVSGDFNYRNMENALMNTVLEEENMTTIPQNGSDGLQEEPEEPEVKKQWGKLGVALLTGAAVFAGAMFGLQSFSDEYVYGKTEAEYQTCLTLIAQENYEEALKSAERLLEEDKTNLEYLSLKHTICKEIGKEKAQIKVLRKIIAQDPDNYPAYEHLLQLYLDSGNQTAIEKLALDPPNSIISAMVKACLVDAPYLELPPGVYDSNQTLELTSEQGHDIYYTMDGTSPQENGTLYTQPIPLEQGYRYTITAVCQNETGNYGDETTGEYQIGIGTEIKDSSTIIEPPVVYPESGVYTSPQRITIDVPFEKQAYYSWTLGTLLTPENGALYTGGIAMPEGESMLSVILTDGNGNCSEVKQVSYNYQPQP